MLTLNDSIICLSSYEKKISDQNWADINNAMNGMNVANVLNLIDLILALPPTSVLNETGFSQLKLIKTDRRHRLNQERLNHIMEVKLNGPPIKDFNPDQAIDDWMVSYIYHLSTT